MRTTLLDALRGMTKVVADTGDFESIVRFKPQDSTTNPSLITAAAQLPQYKTLVDDVLQQAKGELGSSSTDKDVASLAFKRLAVAFGAKILAIIPGRVSTEVDARLSFDKEATLEQARDIIQQYDTLGISRDRVLIKIASTWEGIQAAKQLESEGIHCNLTLLFGMHQAVACAEANVTLISPFVGRILDWYKNATKREYNGPDDPGVQSVTAIYNYFKKFDYPTVIMGASFRNVSEIKELAGCDLLTISPKLLAELDSDHGSLERKLSPEQAKKATVERMTMDQEAFERMHQNDTMAREKLAEGIEGFSAALKQLEQLLANRLSELGANTHAALAAS
jgi:transaldolase